MWNVFFWETKYILKENLDSGNTKCWFHVLGSLHAVLCNWRIGYISRIWQHWLIDWLIDWLLIDWLTDWLIDSFSHSFIVTLNSVLNDDEVCIVICKVFAWLMTVGSRFDDWVYWHFFTITIYYNSSHIELLSNAVWRTSVKNLSLVSH
jgi:hypothetical protein